MLIWTMFLENVFSPPSVSTWFSSDYCELCDVCKCSRDHYCFISFGLLGFLTCSNSTFCWVKTCDKVSLSSGRTNICNFLGKPQLAQLSQELSYWQRMQRTFWRHTGNILAALCFINHSCYRIHLKMLKDAQAMATQEGFESGLHQK